jgi:spore germination protein KC
MKKIIILLIILLPLLTGCYNYRELNDLSIVTAMSIEKNNDLYKVTVQVVNPKKETDTSKGNQPSFITYNTTSQSIQKALREMIKESPNKMYAAHVELLIIDEELAKEGISPILDFLIRDPELRDEFYVLISQDKNILETITPLDNLTSESITKSIKNLNKYLGITSITTYSDLIDAYLDDNKQISLPSIKLEGNLTEGNDKEDLEKTNTEAKLVLSNMTVFKKDKLIGYLDEYQSIAYNFIKDNITNTLIKSTYDDGFIIHEIISSKTKIEVNPKENKVKIKLSGTSSISEVYTKKNLTEYKNIQKIEKIMNNNIEKLIEDSFYNIVKKYNTDIFNFKDLYYKKDVNYFNKIKDEYEKNILPNIKLEVKATYTIREKGNLTGGIYK